MSNNIWEDALLLAAGGIVGLIAGAALMSDDDEEEDDCEMPNVKTQGIEALIASLSEEAQQAVASCETEEERDDVRERIQRSIQQLQEDLAKRNVESASEQEAPMETNPFVNLEDGTMPKPEESFSDQDVQNVQHILSKLSDALNSTKADPSVTNHPSAPAFACDS